MCRKKRKPVVQCNLTSSCSCQLAGELEVLAAGVLAEVSFVLLGVTLFTPSRSAFSALGILRGGVTTTELRDVGDDVSPPASEEAPEPWLTSPLPSPFDPARHPGIHEYLLQSRARQLRISLYRHRFRDIRNSCRVGAKSSRYGI